MGAETPDQDDDRRAFDELLDEADLPDTLAALKSGAIWAQMGTIGVEATERLISEVAGRRPDVAFVDAPVSGSREPARNGRLLILASGPDRARTGLEPVFGALGQRTLWLGPAGTGSRMKLVLNTWLAFEIEAVAEVSALADRLGIPPGEVVDAVSGGPLASGTALAKLARMQTGDYSTDFSLEWALKDLDLATAAAGSVATPVAGPSPSAGACWSPTGHGHLDIGAARLGLDGRTKQDSVDPLRTKDRAPAEVRQ